MAHRRSATPTETDLSPPAGHERHVPIAAGDTPGLLFYRVRMAEAEAPGRKFANFIRDARRRLGWTQDDLLAQSTISRRTLLRWEAGDVERPSLEQIRNLVVVLQADPREAVVALGLMTRDEMGLPAEPAPLNPEVAELQKLLSNEMIPARARAGLVRMVKATRIAWLDVVGTRPAKEPETPERPRKASRRPAA